MLKSIHTRHNDVLVQMLRSNREAQRLRQSDLAIRLGLDQATISKVERRERRLDVVELRAWLCALDVDFLAFMSELNNRLEGMPIPDAVFRARRGGQIRRGDPS